MYAIRSYYELVVAHHLIEREHPAAGLRLVAQRRQLALPLPETGAEALEGDLHVVVAEVAVAESYNFV